MMILESLSEAYPKLPKHIVSEFLCSFRNYYICSC